MTGIDHTSPSWVLDGPVTSRFAHPRGVRGHLAGLVMQVSNERAVREVAARVVPLRPATGCWRWASAPACCCPRSPPGRSRRGCWCRPVAGDARQGSAPAPYRRSAARLRTADLQPGSAAEAGLADGSVDHVVSVNTVAIWPDLDAGLTELRRVLRPGGTLLLAWHRAGARSPVSRRLGLPAHAIARIEDGLRQRFTDVSERN